MFRKVNYSSTQVFLRSVVEERVGKYFSPTKPSVLAYSLYATAVVVTERTVVTRNSCNSRFSRVRVNR